MPSKLQTLTIVGVPEHFNAPFHLGKESGVFEKHGIEINFIDCPGGTGEMTGKLNSEEADIAVALTEGLITCMAKNEAKFKLIGEYTRSPLVWAISSSPNNHDLKSVQDIEGRTIGISRFGSGSHIMGYVLAKENGFKKENRWAVLKNFKGLRDGVNNNDADVFLWEKFTTKPFHDSNEVTKIGEIVTPWPAFMIAMSDAAFARTDASTVKSLLCAIFESCRNFKENKNNDSARYVANTYGNTLEDALNWLSTVEYSSSGSLSKSVLSSVVDILKDANVLSTSLEVTPEKFVHDSVATLQN